MTEKQLAETVKRIELTARQLVDEQFSGQSRSLFKGRGLEFCESREYVPGDDVRSIDWNVTARQGRPYIKLNVEEREMSLVIAVDISASQEFGSKSKTKRELAGEIGAVLALAALRHNNKAGLLLYGHEVEKYIKPKKGRRQAFRIIREILQPEATEGNSGTELGGALAHLSRVHPRRAMVFVLSDFLTDPFGPELSVAHRRFDLTALRVSDPREYSIPSVGRIRVRDLETGEQLVLNTNDREFQREQGRYFAGLGQRLKQGFMESGIDFCEFLTDQDYAPDLIRFLARREGRARRVRRSA